MLALPVMVPNARDDTLQSDIQEFERFVKQRRRQGSRGLISSNSAEAGCFYVPDTDLVTFFEDEDRLMRILRHIIPSPSYHRQHHHILERIKEGEYLKVFAILLLIHHGYAIQYFLENPELSDAKLPFDKGAADKFPNPASEPYIFDAFFKQQWMFCVTKLRYRKYVKYSENQILPFQTEDLEYLRSGSSSRGLLITVDPEYDELYTRDRRLNGSFPSAGQSTNLMPLSGNDPHRFVLKIFQREIPDGKEQYDQELESYANILHAGNDQNIVSFFGSFKHGDTFHIILEYANKGTLEDLMEKSPPPTGPEALHELWGALLRLLQAFQKLHDLPFEGNKGCLCHCDLKPRNILVFVQRNGHSPLYEFKLADLGLSRLSLEVGVAMLNLAPAGTRTYGAPELFRSLNEPVLRPVKARPSADIWSLGCIFIEVAVWLRGGFEYLKDFRQMRLEAHRGSGTNLERTDCFHDGVLLLESIENYLQSLRDNVEIDDPLTAKVLTFVMEHMLVDRHRRGDANELWRQAERMHYDSRTMRSSLPIASPPDPLTGCPWPLTPFHLQEGSSFTSQGQLAAPDIGPPSDQGTLERSPTPHPPSYRPLPLDTPFQPSSSESQGPYIQLPPDPSFDQINSHHRHLHHPAAPQQHALGTVSNRTTDVGSAVPRQDSIGSQHGSCIKPVREFSSSIHMDYPTRICPITQISAEAKSYVQEDAVNPSKPSDCELVSAETVNNQSKPKRISSTYSELSASPDSFCRRTSHVTSNTSGERTQKSPLNPPHLSNGAPSGAYANWRPAQAIIPPPHAVRSEFPHISFGDALRDRYARQKLPPHHTVELKNRDIVFLLDDSCSMRCHWLDVEDCTNGLTYQVKHVDKDGMELRFTWSNLKKKGRPGKSKGIVKEVRKRKPRDQQWSTNIYASLGSLLEEYRSRVENRRTEKKLVIYMLTDGLWQPRSADQLKGSIRSLISVLNLNEFPQDQIGIEFIQFGSDQEATRVLHDLDTLGEREKLGRDIIDFEQYHSKANILKMLLGSINKWADNDEVINEIEVRVEKTVVASPPNTLPPANLRSTAS